MYSYGYAYVYSKKYIFFFIAEVWVWINNNTPVFTWIQLQTHALTPMLFNLISLINEAPGCCEVQYSYLGA